MSIPMPPSPPKRPEFGAWADLPRAEWTEGQAREFDEKMAVYKQESEAMLAWLADFPKSIKG